MIKQSLIASVLKKELEKTSNGKDTINESDLHTFLEQYKGADRIVRSDEIEKSIDLSGVRKGMKTGMDDLDVLLGGFYEEQVIVLTAYPKSGKTAWALHTINSMKEYNPLFLALEQSARELIEQLKERNMPIPVFYTPDSLEQTERTTDWIHLKIIESQYRSAKDSTQPTKIVFIDHFGYILRKQSSDQITWEIIRTMQELKDIARQTKTAIVVIVHTTKPDETEPPTTKDLFGSAGYHQEADTVLSLWRESYKENKQAKKTNNVLLQVLANRRKGDVGAIKLTFDNGRFIRNDWINAKDQKSDNELTNFVKGF